MAKRPRAQWAEKISAAWRSSVEAIFECGRLLIDAKEAKDKLPHGEFQKMINRDLPFGEGTAQRLMKIARDERLSKPAHGPLLPQSWRTLYELTFLDDEEFSTAIESGLINPDLMRSEAVELRRRWKEADESVPLRYPEQSDLRR